MNLPDGACADRLVASLWTSTVVSAILATIIMVWMAIRLVTLWEEYLPCGSDRMKQIRMELVDKERQYNDHAAE